MMKLRDDAHTTYYKTKLKSDNTYYKDLKSIVNVALRNEISALFEYKFNQFFCNSRTLWKNFKPNLIDFNKKHVEFLTPLCDLNLVNNHFLSSPGNDCVPISELTFYEFHRFSSAMFALRPVDIASLLKTISKISTNGAGYTKTKTY